MIDEFIKILYFYPNYNTLNQMLLSNKRIAIISNSKMYSYRALQHSAKEFAGLLLDSSVDLQGARVAFMIEPGFDYVATQWGIWKAGGVAVPLCISYPLPSLTYVIENAEASLLVVSEEFEAMLEGYVADKAIRFIVLGKSEMGSVRRLPRISTTRNAMILYTSGTTNLPKGVVTTHANIEAQIGSLLQAWAYSDKDHTLCILPLHHVHGVINVISCTLWAGGTVEFLDHFSAEGVFAAFELGRVNVFMAVPTIYHKLIAYYDTLSPERRERLTEIMKKFRLMVSGSAALPVSVMERWEAISGQRLLERYGMTELGMAISNPYQGERRAGHIGQPLPGVEVRLVDETNQWVAVGEPGEIQVKGENVFKEYWKKEETTEAAFTKDAWFKTGDMAVVEDGYYKILGRSSIDIIKSGGYKISALEIEEVLRTHSAIQDCSVVGIEKEEWGEIVAAALITNTPELGIEELNRWIREILPGYKVPRKYIFLKELPRNVMGKVVKSELKTFFNG